MTTINTHFILKPDYSTPVDVTVTWRTGLQKAISSREHRLMIFSWGRLGIRFAITSVDYTETAYLRRKIWKFQGGIVGVPVWPDLDKLIYQAIAAQPEIELEGSTDFTFYKPGRPIVLMDPTDREVFESGVIDSVDGAVITLESNLSNTWDAGTEIAPVIAARIGDRNSFRFLTDRIVGSRIEANEAFE